MNFNFSKQIFMLFISFTYINSWSYEFGSKIEEVSILTDDSVLLKGVRINWSSGSTIKVNLQHGFSSTSYYWAPVQNLAYDEYFNFHMFETIENVMEENYQFDKDLRSYISKRLSSFWHKFNITHGIRQPAKSRRIMFEVLKKSILHELNKEIKKRKLWDAYEFIADIEIETFYTQVVALEEKFRKQKRKVKREQFKKMAMTRANAIGVDIYAFNFGGHGNGSAKSDFIQGDPNKNQWKHGFDRLASHDVMAITQKMIMDGKLQLGSEVNPWLFWIGHSMGGMMESAATAGVSMSGDVSYIDPLKAKFYEEVYKGITNIGSPVHFENQAILSFLVKFLQKEPRLIKFFLSIISMATVKNYNPIEPDERFDILKSIEKYFDAKRSEGIKSFAKTSLGSIIFKRIGVVDPARYPAEKLRKFLARGITKDIPIGFFEDAVRYFANVNPKTFKEYKELLKTDPEAADKMLMKKIENEGSTFKPRNGDFDYAKLHTPASIPKIIVSMGHDGLGFDYDLRAHVDYQTADGKEAKRLLINFPDFTHADHGHADQARSVIEYLGIMIKQSVRGHITQDDLKVLVKLGAEVIIDKFPRKDNREQYCQKILLAS